jgi:drug/metabolite transporter (DMT)-like permease
LPSSDSPRPSSAALVSAFGALYLVWGSTYLAIRVAIETLPPFLMAGVRFVVAGLVLLAWVRLRGGPRPAAGEWRRAWITGGLLLAGGNGAVVWAEQWIPSGLVALLVASVPLWMVLVDWLWGRGSRPSAGLLLGMGWGLFGVGLLVAGQGMGPGGPLGIVAGMVVVGGSISWAVGSILARYAPAASSPQGATARQMLAGGALLSLAAILTGELGRFDPGAVSLRSVLALVYLVVFGSLVAFSAYVWLLKASTPARVSTYAYVNPAVALFLGWALAGEPVGARTLVASAIVLSAVMLITRRSGPGRSPGTGAPERLEGGGVEGTERGAGDPPVAPAVTPPQLPLPPAVARPSPGD